MIAAFGDIETWLIRDNPIIVASATRSIRTRCVGYSWVPPLGTPPPANSELAILLGPEIATVEDAPPGASILVDRSAKAHIPPWSAE